MEGGEKVIVRDKPNLMIEVYDKFNKYPVETTLNFVSNMAMNVFIIIEVGLQPVKDTDHGVKVAYNARHNGCDSLFIYCSRT